MKKIISILLLICTGLLCSFMCQAASKLENYGSVEYIGSPDMRSEEVLRDEMLTDVVESAKKEIEQNPEKQYYVPQTNNIIVNFAIPNTTIDSYNYSTYKNSAENSSSPLERFFGGLM